MLWFALGIPAILIIVFLTIKKFRERMVWWEIAIPAVITVITIIICQVVAIKSATNDKEFWGHMGKSIVHNEPFAYDSECPETYQCGTSCDSKGNCTPTYCTRWVHCVQNSPRQCYLVDDKNNDHYISYSKYKELDERWGHNEYGTKVIVTQSHGYTTKGDKYKRSGHGNQHWVKWDKKWETSEPIVETHTYENRLQTQSNWKKVDEKLLREYGIFEYPLFDGGWVCSTLLVQAQRYPKAEKYLRYLNGQLNTMAGGYKRVRLWVLVFNDKDQNAAEYQRMHWKGGNKNEFVVMIGKNIDDTVMWVDVMTWSESDTLTIETRDHLNLEFAEGKNGYSGKVTDTDMLKFSAWLGKAVRKLYIKPDFKKFNYIEVQPSQNAVLITYAIVLFVNIGAGFFIYLNPWMEGHATTYRRRSRYNHWRS